jgi:hypothetical protein
VEVFVDQLTPEVIDFLLNPVASTCIAIYMPTYRKGADIQQNPIRFRNLMKKTKELLSTSRLSNHQLKNIMVECQEAIDTPEYWQHQSNGLAVFISPDHFLRLRLPLKFPEVTVVNTHFHFKPILPLLTNNGKFFILTLSLKDIKLYEATRTDIGKRFIPDVPKNPEELFGTFVSEHQLASYRQNNKNGSSTKNNSYSQGSVGEEPTKKNSELFIQAVASAIGDVLKNETAPLVLAGTEHLTSTFEKHNKHKHLHPTTITGSPENTTKEKLHKEAWKIVRPIFKQEEKDALSLYQQLDGTGRTGRELNEVLPAAYQGKVDQLFVARDQQLWGEFDLKDMKVNLHDQQVADSVDLYDIAVLYTLKNSGNVYSLKPKEMVKKTKVAAVYRY